MIKSRNMYDYIKNVCSIMNIPLGNKMKREFLEN